MKKKILTLKYDGNSVKLFNSDKVYLGTIYISKYDTVIDARKMPVLF